MLPQATKGNSTAHNGNKKRAASEKPDAGEREGAGAPAKKAKVRTFQKNFPCSEPTSQSQGMLLE